MASWELPKARERRSKTWADWTSYGGRRTRRPGRSRKCGSEGSRGHVPLGGWSKRSKVNLQAGGPKSTSRLRDVQCEIHHQVDRR